VPVIATAEAEEFWRQIPALEMVETVSGGVPDQLTQVKIAWDDSAWRILFLAQDIEPWATLTERDAPLYREEVVEVFFDPIGDLQSYFEIEVNPLNAVCDLVLRKNRSGLAKDFRWNCAGLSTAATRVGKGWKAEFSIPFASVASGPPKVGEVWRANFLRIDRPSHRERELSAWSPTGRAQFHLPERFGFVEFSA
jgi:hypothetical protein